MRPIDAESLVGDVRLAVSGSRRPTRVVRLASYGVFIPPRDQLRAMKSTRKGLRDGDLFKYTYERLNCADCEKVLKKKNDPDEVFSVRVCPECGATFKELR